MAPNKSFSVTFCCFFFILVVAFSRCTQSEQKATLTGWQAPKEADKLKIPFENNAIAATKGKELYNVYCWTCHGEAGYGDGAAGSTGDQIPANFHSNRVKRQSDGALFWKINEGKGVMPSFKEALTEEQRWQLVAYIRQLSDMEFERKPPKALKEGITVEHFMDVGPEAVRLLWHQSTGDIYYTAFNGDVFKVRQHKNRQPDSIKILSVKEHGITRLQGAVIFKNTMFLSGNVDLNNKKGTSGRMVRYELPAADTSGIPDTARLSVVFTTVEYGANKTIYDHGWNALEISPDGKWIYVNSGARTDHGEVQDNGGTYPNARDNALTSKIFRFPFDAKNLFLEDDLEKLKQAGYIYAEGIRNAYDMAFDQDSHLFAVSNSSDYDNNEDMFWVREGHHYGFPWVMGGIDNPQQYPGWNPDPKTDLFIHESSHSWQVRYYHDDSTFPKIPEGVRFSPGVQNLGPDANEYRSHSGKILDGDQTGVTTSTFTPHSSPLGLFFDTQKKLPGEYRGDGFVIRYTLGARSGMMRSFTREGADLLHLEMEYNKAADNYFVKTRRVVDGFVEPTDAIQTGNTVYVIEYGGKKGSIWKIIFEGSNVKRQT